jgi:hypothetical protein
MAETQEELSNTELQESTFDVMSEALDNLHKNDSVVEATEEVVNDEPIAEQPAESDVKAPTFEEAQNAQQDTRSGDDTAEESEEELQTSEGVQATEGLESEDVDVYDNLKPKAQERFKHWIDKANNLETEYNTMMQGNNQLHGIIQGSTTNPQQLGWALEMFKGLNSGNYTTAVNSLKALDQFSNQIAKTLGVQTEGNSSSSFSDFEDLSGAVENLEMSEEWANKLASQRVAQNSMHQAQNTFQAQNHQQANMMQQMEVGKNTAFQQIEAWENNLTEKDPDYSLKKDIMIEMGTQLAQSDVPPDQWLPVLQNQYQMLSRGMGVAGESKVKASRRSGPLAPGSGNSGTTNATNLKQAEVTPEFLQAHLDALHG